MRIAPYAVLAAVLFAAAPTQATIINGSLTTTDWFSYDDFGTFYVDAYEFTVAADTEITVSLLSDDFAPYVSMWDTAVLPTSAWQDVGIDIYLTTVAIALELSPSQTASFVFDALAGVTYQLALTSTYYLEDPFESALGDYKLTVAAASTAPEPIVAAIPDPTIIPEPATLLLIATGLLAAGARARRHGRS